MSEYRVEIVEDATGKVVKSLPAYSERAAEKLENGMIRNLNHAKYSTRIIAPTQTKEGPT